MKNKIKGGVIALALAAGTLLPVGTANASMSPALVPQVSDLVAGKAPCFAPWDFVWWFSLGLQGYRWRC